MTQTNRCGKGHLNPEGQRFCGDCGASLEAGTAEIDLTNSSPTASKGDVVSPEQQVGNTPQEIVGGKKRKVRILVLVTLIVLGVLFAGFFAFRSAGRDRVVSLASVEDDGWASCYVFHTKGSYLIEMLWSEVQGGTTPPGDALARGCDVEIERVGGGWSVSYDPGADRGGSGIFAVYAFGEATGCLQEVDHDKLESTRPIDGRVESASGKTSWTYSSDSGLTLICED